MDMHTAITKKLAYYKRVQKEIDARKTKASLILLRKQWIDKQNINNYQNEYDRIRGILNTSVTGELTNDKLNARKVKLEQLGARIIDQNCIIRVGKCFVLLLKHTHLFINHNKYIPCLLDILNTRFITSSIK